MGQNCLIRGEIGKRENVKENVSMHSRLTSISCQQARNYSISAMWVISVLVKISHDIFFLFFLLIIALPLESQEQDANFKISSSGIFRGARIAIPHIWVFPLYVPDHCVWKPAHHPGHQLRPPPPHPHVLLPLQPVLCRHLLHLLHHSKDAVEHPDPEQSHNLWRVHYSDVFYIIFMALEDFLLVVMTYDQYVAICYSLNYSVIMNTQLCALLFLVSWKMSSLYSLLQSLMALQLSFCSDLEIPHFFCEIKKLIQLACSDIFINNMVVYFGAGIIGVVPLASILYSYSKIVSSICRISSVQENYKAFSTCASHLSIVSLFYFTGLGVYLSSAATHSSN